MAHRIEQGRRDVTRVGDSEDAVAEGFIITFGIDDADLISALHQPLDETECRGRLSAARRSREEQRTIEIGIEKTSSPFSDLA